MRLKRLIACVLSIAMITTVIPVNVSAQDMDAKVQEMIQEEISVLEDILNQNLSQLADFGGGSVPESSEEETIPESSEEETIPESSEEETIPESSEEETIPESSEEETKPESSESTVSDNGIQSELDKERNVIYNIRPYAQASYELTYKINRDNTISITGTSGTAQGELVIPAEIDGRAVTIIGVKAFENTEFTGALVIPNSVERIETSAFLGADFNGDLFIPDSVIYIGESAFNTCREFTGDLLIPNSVTYIGDMAFSNCGFTGELVISDSITSINQFTFSGVDFTGDLKIPKGLTSIGTYAFAGSSFTGELLISNRVTSISNEAFRSAKFTGDLIIPDSVTSIGSRAFWRAKFTGSLVIGDGVTYLGDGVFEDCGFTGDLIIGNSLTSIDRKAFWRLGFTGDLVIGNSVTEIGELAFEDCGFTGDLIMPKNVTQLNYNAFDGSNNFKMRYVDKGSKGEKWLIYEDYTYPKDYNYLGPSIPINADEYVICIRDDDDSVVANASVTYENVKYKTDVKGSIRVPFDDARSNHTVIVSGDGYHPYTLNNYKQNLETRQDVLRISKNPFNLLEASILLDQDEYDITDEVYQINISNAPTVMLEISVVQPESVGTYVLKFGDEIIEEVIYPQFHLKTTDVEKLIEYNGDISVDIYDKENKLQKNEKIKIRAYNNEPIPEELTLSIGEEMEFTVEDTGTFMDGLNVKLDMPLLPFALDIEDNKVKIGINLAEIEGPEGRDLFGSSEWDSFKGKFERSNFAKENPLNWIENNHREMGAKNAFISTNPSVSFGICGYAEGDLSEGTLDGKLYIEVSLGGTFEAQAYVFVAAVSIKGTLEAGGEVNLSFSPFEMDGSIYLKPTAALSVFGGVGMANIASVGVYGEGSTSFEMNLLSTNRPFFESWSIGGNLGLAARLLGQEFRWTLLGVDNIYLYQNTEKPQMVKKQQSSSGELTNTANYQPIPRVNLDLESEWLGEKPVVSPRTSGVELAPIHYLQTNTYSDIRPLLVETGDTLMQVYTADIASRTDGNQSSIVYSVFDKANRTWSEPVQIADDGKADYNPVVYSHESKIFVLWQNAKKEFTANETIDNKAKELELTLSVFENGSFSEPDTITNNSILENMPSLFHDGSQIVVSWTENSDDPIFGESGITEVYQSTKNLTGNWVSTKVEGVNENEIVVWQDCKKWQGKNAIAVLIDTDKNLMTTADRKLFVYDLDTSTKLYEGAAESATFETLGNTEELFVFSENALWQIVNNQKVRITSADSFIPQGSQIIVKEDQVSGALWTVTKDGKADIYASFKDNASNLWGEPTVLLNQPNYIENLSTIEFNNETILTFTQRSHDMVTEQETNSLCWSSINYQSEMELVSLINDDTSAIDKEGIVIYATVQNKGTSSIKNIDWNFTNNGNINLNTSTPVDILVGESKTIKLQIADTEIALMEEVTVTATISDEIMVGDNSKTVIIGRPDLRMADISLSDDIIMTTVENRGHVPMSGSIELVKEDGSVCFSSDLGELQKNEIATMQTVIGKDFQLDKEFDQKLTARIVSTTEQGSSINDKKEVMIYGEKVAPSTIKMKESKVTIDEGSTYQLEVETTSANPPLLIQWSSSDESIATVEDGLVTSVKAGVVSIKAQAVADNSVFDVCEVTIIGEEEKVNVSLSSQDTDGNTGIVTLIGAGEYEANQQATVVAPDKEGYEFLGWYVDAYDVSATPVSTNLSYTFSAVGTEMTLIAVYAKESIGSISVKPNDFNFGSKNVGYVEADLLEQTFTITNISDVELTLHELDLVELDKDVNFSFTQLINSTLAPNEATTFTIKPKMGLPLSEGGAYQKTIQITGNNMNEVKEVTVSFQVTDKAIYSISVENGSPTSASYEANTAVTVIADELEGKRFKEWVATGLENLQDLDLAVSPLLFAMPAESVTLEAVYEDIATVTFDSKGGSAIAEKIVVINETVTLPTPTKSNYRFEGWFLGEKEFTNETIVEGDITLEARWVYIESLPPETDPSEDNGSDNSSSSQGQKPPKPTRPATTVDSEVAIVTASDIEKVINQPIKAGDVLPEALKGIVDDQANVMFAKEEMVLTQEVLETLKKSDKPLSFIFDDYSVTVIPSEIGQAKDLKMKMEIETETNKIRVTPEAKGTFGTNVIFTVMVTEELKDKELILYYENNKGIIVNYGSVEVDPLGYIRFPMSHASSYFITDQMVLDALSLEEYQAIENLIVEAPLDLVTDTVIEGIEEAEETKEVGEIQEIEETIEAQETKEVDSTEEVEEIKDVEDDKEKVIGSEADEKSTNNITWIVFVVIAIIGVSITFFVLKKKSKLRA